MLQCTLCDERVFDGYCQPCALPERRFDYEVCEEIFGWKFALTVSSGTIRLLTGPNGGPASLRQLADVATETTMWIIPAHEAWAMNGVKKPLVHNYSKAEALWRMQEMLTQRFNLKLGHLFYSKHYGYVWQCGSVRDDWQRGDVHDDDPRACALQAVRELQKQANR